jgi:hypothetical protein
MSHQLTIGDMFYCGALVSGLSANAALFRAPLYMYVSLKSASLGKRREAIANVNRDGLSADLG